MNVVGRIDGRTYEEHVKTPAVQEMLARARRSWEETYGYDPAASRLKGSS